MKKNRKQELEHGQESKVEHKSSTTFAQSCFPLPVGIEAYSSRAIPFPGIPVLRLTLLHILFSFNECSNALRVNPLFVPTGHAAPESRSTWPIHDVYLLPGALFLRPAYS